MTDLRRLLDTARADAPPPRLAVDDIVEAAHQRQRRIRRLGAGGGIAVVTALVLVGGNLALSGGPAAGPPAALPAPVVEAPPQVPPFTFTISGYRVGGYRVLPPQEVTAAYQVASILADYQDASGRPTSAYAGSLTVYRPGVALPPGLASGPRLTVRGRDAYQHQLSGEYRAPGNRVETVAEPGAATVLGPVTGPRYVLAWQYAEKAWAVITSLPNDPDHVLPADVEVALADRFQPGPPVRARTPFQVGYLPAGWRLDSVNGQTFAAEDTGIVSVTYAPADPAPAASTSPPGSTPTRRPAVTITIAQQDARPPDAATKTERCSAAEHWCTWPIPGTRFYVSLSDLSETVSTDELLAIGQGLVFSDLDRPDTWPAVP